MNIKNITNSNVNLTKMLFRSGHALELKDAIENLNNFKSPGKPLSSINNELNNIVNNKDNDSIIYLESINKSSTKNNTILPNLIFPNNQIKTDLKSIPVTSIQNTAKYFHIGNKFMSFNMFRSLLNNFNTDIKNIQNNTQEINTNNLRYYLNLLTNFEYSLLNNYNMYRFNKTNKYVFAMKKAAKFLNVAFNSKGCFISRPSFNLIITNNDIENEIINNLRQNQTSTKVVINFFYYVKTSEVYNSIVQNDNARILSDLFGEKFIYLTDYLTNLFNTEVELNMTRLYLPHQDASILVQALNVESYSNKFIRMISRLFKIMNIDNSNKSEIFDELNLLAIGKNNYTSYPSNVSGVSVKLAGRPLNERIIPRLTVKRAQRGSFNRLNAKMIEKSIYTDKTRKGAYSFTVTLSQKFNQN